ncbi:hypothetical protein PENSPDRAFT_695165 [Peniophora sp. CONT]|nr:hypothetical protein PENSPDRAFT_695165 [Peniophora sp. CONT]
MREIEVTNGLPANSITAAHYIKPEELRAEDQRHANVMLTINRASVANDTILNGIVVCAHWSQCWRQNRDRHCPSFLRRCTIYDSRHPENCRIFFPTDELWTHEAMVEPGQPFESYHLMGKPRARTPARRQPATIGQSPVAPARSIGNQKSRRRAGGQDLDSFLNTTNAADASPTAMPPH